MTDIKDFKVLARKYRPQTFADLIGQDILVQILTNAITTNKIANAYLLTGVRGVGKTTTARLIAMSLNCQNKKQDTCEPCGNCESCNSIKLDHNLDVIEMDAASKTGVDDVREIIDNVKYKPINNEYKIFIIDEVHMLSKSAFNALLKTLEEPPEHVKFIFATTEAKKIPVTILSRCQRFDLKRVESLKLSLHLKKISELEKVKIDDGAIALLVRAGDGSVRDSLSLLDQAIINNNQTVSVDSVTKMLGLADRGKIYDLIENIAKGNAAKSLAVFRDLYNSGADILMIFEELLSAVHSITQIKISPEIQDDISIPELERSKGVYFSDQLSMNSLSIMWQVLFKGFEELQNGFHLYQHGEMILLRLIFLSKEPNPNKKIKETTSEQSEQVKLESKDIDLKKKNNLDNNTTNTYENKPAVTGGFPLIRITNFRSFVDFFYMKREALLHTQLYNSVKLISFKEGEVTLNTSVIKDQHFNRNIAKLISKWTGRIWQIHSSDSNIGSSLSDEDVINQQNEIKIMKNHPQVKKILEALPGLSIHSITDITETVDETTDENDDERQKEI
ncbi:MAG: DNA polymerase III subunit gamma/tau [Pelagibacteraceae bacterium]|nr:DNA polymerase III subunit gamma/tau [Pelagibacteraceae bacterium]MBT5214154.1 DNA polymerase III subunit gamma/tau [Pelagibacteraceae bacterium]MBT6355321.1 DNA polymerase III subunit gamma/tau [Pelagibacteraceae bacterium]